MTIDVEHELEEHDKRITKLEDCVITIEKGLAELTGASGTTLTLIKYVILPLLIIVGGLVGIKLTMP